MDLNRILSKSSPGLSVMAISRQTWRFSNSFGDLIFEMATGDFCGDFSSEWRFSWRFYTHKNHHKRLEIHIENWIFSQK